MSRKQYLPLFTFRFAFFQFVSTFGFLSIPPFIFLLFFCSSADHSSASFEVDEQKTVFATFHLSLCIFLVCFYTLDCFLFYLSFSCCSFAHQPLIPVHRLR